MDARSSDIYGLDLGQFGGSPEAWFALLHPEDRDAVMTRMQMFMEGKARTFDTTIRVINPRSGTRFLQLGAQLERDVHGKLLRMVGVVRDVTDERMHEQELQESLRHMRAVFDNIFNCIVTSDEKGTITSFNPASEAVFGWKASEAIGQNVSILTPPYHARNHHRYIDSYLAGNEPKVIGRVRELEGMRKNGEIFPMEFALTEFHRRTEHGFVGVIRDLTHLNLVHRTQSEFIATVSHELRTPLTSIVAAVDLLRFGAGGTMSERGVQLLDNARRNCQRLIGLVEDLLDMEQVSSDQLSFDMEAHSVKTLLEQALEANQVLARSRDVSIVLWESASEVAIRVDETRFEQIMSNFLSNAIKFSPKGAEVIVEATPEGKNLICSVSDFGSGVPDAFRERLFQRFSQADSSDVRNTGGTGLGLAISKELATKMDGSIGYAPAESGGAKFWVSFPIVKGQPES